MTFSFPLSRRRLLLFLAFSHAAYPRYFTTSHLPNMAKPKCFWGQVSGERRDGFPNQSETPRAAPGPRGYLFIHCSRSLLLSDALVLSLSWWLLPSDFCHLFPVSAFPLCAGLRVSGYPWFTSTRELSRTPQDLLHSQWCAHGLPLFLWGAEDF